MAAFSEDNLGVGRICSFKQFPVETFGNEIALYNTIRVPGANSLCFDGFCYCFCFTECFVFLYRTDQQEGSTYKPIQLYTANKAVSYTDQNALYHKATLKNCISNLAVTSPRFLIVDHRHGKKGKYFGFPLHTDPYHSGNLKL